MNKKKRNSLAIISMNLLRQKKREGVGLFLPFFFPTVTKYLCLTVHLALENSINVPFFSPSQGRGPKNEIGSKQERQPVEQKEKFCGVVGKKESVGYNYKTTGKKNKFLGDL